MSEQTKTSTPLDLSGLIKSGPGSPYVKPIAEKPVETQPVVALPAIAIAPQPAPMIVKTPAHDTCAHVFVCCLCNARLLPTEDKTTAVDASATVPEDVLLDDMRVERMSPRSPQEIAELLKYETPEMTSRRIANDKQRFLYQQGL